MNKICFLIFLLFINHSVKAKVFDVDSSITNLKYGYQLGDLIIVKDDLVNNQKFPKKPELIVTSNEELKIIKQTNIISHQSDRYIFTNTIIYQIFKKSKSGYFKLPTRQYKINDDLILMPEQSFWFTRISESKLNNVLINSIDQKKPSIFLIKSNYLFILSGITILSLLILLYKHIDFPLLQRMNGPFAKAFRKIKSLHKNNCKENYVDSILILTDAFNKTFNNNITNSNYKDLIDEHIKFKEVSDEIKIFVGVSSIEIYSSKTFFTKLRFKEIYNFSKILRTIERKI